MSSETQDQTNLKSSTGLNWMDTLSGLGVIGGTAASVVTQQVALATVPLSLAMLLQIMSRQQKVNALVEANLSMADAVLAVQKNVNALTEETQQVGNEHQRLISELSQENNKHNLESITLKERLDEHAGRLAEQAGQLDAFDSTLQSIKEVSAVGVAEAQAMSAEAHVNRGNHQEKLGHLEIAIEEYSQAITQSNTFAEAYLRRALAKAELGRKQSAVIDLNLATKYFFESGDLTNYQRAKDIANNLHKVEEEASTATEKTEEAELVSVSGLFD